LQPFINIFGRDIPTYGLLLISGAVIGWFLFSFLVKRKNLINSNDAMFVYLIAISGAGIGSVTLRPIMNIIGVIFSWENYRGRSIIELFNYVTGEVVFLGGLLGGLIAVVLFCRYYKISIPIVFDLAAPAVAIGHSIGRIGCLLGGCCFGMEVSSTHPFAIVYPTVSLGAPAGVPLLAVPIIESVFLLILAIVLTGVYLKSHKQGLSATGYLIFYPIGRFILEFFRGDIIRGTYGWFTTSQYISMGLFVFGICYCLILQKRKLHV